MFAIILNLKPVLVVLLGYIFGLETITCRKLGYIALSFLGAGLITNPAWFQQVWNRVAGRAVPHRPAHDAVDTGTDYGCK